MNFRDALLIKLGTKGTWKKVVFMEDLITHTVNTENPHQVLVRQTLASPPTAPNSPGQKGDIAIDENYLYVCIAKNTWKRIELTAW